MSADLCDEAERIMIALLASLQTERELRRAALETARRLQLENDRHARVIADLRDELKTRRGDGWI